MRDYGRVADSGAKNRRQVAPIYKDLSRDLQRVLKALQDVRRRIDVLDRAYRRLLNPTGELPSVGLLRAIRPAEEALKKLKTGVEERSHAWSPPGVDERFAHLNVLLYLQKYQEMDGHFTDERIASIMISLGLEEGSVSKVLPRIRSAMNRLYIKRTKWSSG